MRNRTFSGKINSTDFTYALEVVNNKAELTGASMLSLANHLISLLATILGLDVSDFSIQ